MSGILGKRAPDVPEPAASQEGLVEQVEDLLSGIHSGLHDVPEAEPSADHLAELKKQLEEETPEIEAVSIADGELGIDLLDSWEDDDEPTQDWSKEPPVAAKPLGPPPKLSPPKLPKQSTPSKSPEPPKPPIRPRADSWEPAWNESPSSLRPAAMVAEPQRRTPRKRVPIGLAVGAVAAIVAAGAAYALGPKSQDEPTAKRAVATLERAETTPLRAVAPAAAPATKSTQQLMVTVAPSNAYLSLRPIDEKEGRRTTGPWPKIFELEPGEYELVFFRAGFTSVVRRVKIRADATPTALSINLHSEDIYE